jgi:hypothetical protein
VMWCFGLLVFLTIAALGLVVIGLSRLARFPWSLVQIVGICIVLGGLWVGICVARSYVAVDQQVLTLIVPTLKQRQFRREDIVRIWANVPEGDGRGDIWAIFNFLYAFVECRDGSKIRLLPIVSLTWYGSAEKRTINSFVGRSVNEMGHILGLV